MKFVKKEGTKIFNPACHNCGAPNEMSFLLLLVLTKILAQEAEILLKLRISFVCMVVIKVIVYAFEILTLEN